MLCFPDPSCGLPLLAPKSNALYLAYERAKQDALTQLTKPVPLALRNGVTKLMKDLNYGKGYQYAHDAPDKLTTLQCLPDTLVNRVYYQPTDQGQEAKWKARLEQIKRLETRKSACMTFGTPGTAVISAAKGAGTAPWTRKAAGAAQISTGQKFLPAPKDRRGQYKIRRGEMLWVCMTSDFSYRKQTHGGMMPGI